MRKLINNIFEEEEFVLKKYKEKKLIKREIVKKIEWEDRII
jgi:hypothetical protein